MPGFYGQGALKEELTSGNYHFKAKLSIPPAQKKDPGLVGSIKRWVTRILERGFKTEVLVSDAKPDKDSVEIAPTSNGVIPYEEVGVCGRSCHPEKVSGYLRQLHVLISPLQSYVYCTCRQQGGLSQYCC